MQSITHIYGQIGPQILPQQAGAIQLAPLFPGALQLENCADASLPGLLFCAQAGSIERRYALAHALRALQPGATLVAVAAKNKGGKRIAAELREFGCAVVESARKHLRICKTKRPENLQNIDAALKVGALQIHQAHGMWTQPGVFSWDRLDIGSALLLQNLPQLAGLGADFGCGIGVLARTILQQNTVQNLALVDLDFRAIAAAKLNIIDDRAQFIWADIAATTLADASLDFVVMNPPFHAHGTEDKALGQLFIATAAAKLKPAGKCLLVANVHLPYEQLLRSLFAQVQLLVSSGGFKIFMAEK